MYTVFQKQGSMKEEQEVSYVHTSTSVKISKQYLGKSLSELHYTCEGLARLAGYSLEDVQLNETEIVIQFDHSVFEPIHSMKDLNQLWKEVNEACKKILTAYGCHEWFIELGIYEEEDDVCGNVALNREEMEVVSMDGEW